MKRVAGSFRDPCGLVYEDGGRIVRTIDQRYADDWTAAETSGLLAAAVERGLLIPHHELAEAGDSWKRFEAERIPFVTYPYEWCFSQLRDAALLTLALHREALRRGMVLKDATAYNVQFRGSAPVFIDLLSFERWVEGEPWTAYRQFCMHFLAPLALIAYVDLRCSVFSKLWVDGIALDLASRLLPARTWLRFGLLSHLHLHARFENRYGDARQAKDRVKRISMNKKSLVDIADNLAACVGKLRPAAMKTEWGDYYADTNYTDEAAAFKHACVSRMAAEHGGKPLAVDLGANTGRYSEALAPHFATVLALDIDPLAVERHYHKLRAHGPANILPLVMDLANPSPSLGWGCGERDSFAGRCRADLITALALVHHLVITAGIPLAMVAEHFAQLLTEDGLLLLEFVPKQDSQTGRLLAVRKDIFDDYTVDGMRAAFAPHFEDVETHPVPQSLRTLHLFRKRAK